jgi:hypothetical protein
MFVETQPTQLPRLLPTVHKTPFLLPPLGNRPSTHLFPRTWQWQYLNHNTERCTTVDPSGGRQREPLEVVSSMHVNENSHESSGDGTNFALPLGDVCAGEVDQFGFFEVTEGKGLVEDAVVDSLSPGFDVTANVVGKVFRVGLWFVDIRS